MVLVRRRLYLGFPYHLDGFRRDPHSQKYLPETPLGHCSSRSRGPVGQLRAHQMPATSATGSRDLSTRRGCAWPRLSVLVTLARWIRRPPGRLGADGPRGCPVGGRATIRSMDNTLCYGDILDVLRQHVPDTSADLVCLDPPFNLNATHNVLFGTGKGALSEAQIRASDDTWHWAAACSVVLVWRDVHHVDVIWQSPSQRAAPAPF